jgi:hypothetical protein
VSGADAPPGDFALEVKAAITTIRNDPERFPRWNDRYRFAILDKYPYYIAYRVKADVVVIVAIRHASRDQDAWKGR